MLIDLHVHTRYSDGFEASVEDVIEQCRSHGIGGIVLAECDVVPDPAEVRKLAKKLDFPIFIGVDIDAADGRFIAIPPDPSDDRFLDQIWRGDDDDTSAREIIEVMDALEGVVIAAHPYLDDGGPYLGDRIHSVEGLAAVEVACGVRDHLSNDLALEAAAAVGLPVVGGSDTGPEGQRAGWFATAFASDITSQEELVEALQSGLFWAVELRKVEPGEGGKRKRRRRGGPSRD